MTPIVQSICAGAKIFEKCISGAGGKLGLERCDTSQGWKDTEELRVVHRNKNDLM